jgi:hypothetical protein
MEAELLCPACRIPLTEMRTGTGIIWRCEKCDGRAVGLQLLRRTFTAESINPLWLHAIHNEGSSARPCPSCSNPMIEVALDSSSGIKLEVCKICEFVWFDKGETQPLQVRPPPKPPPALLPQKAREAIALARVQQLAEQARGPDFDSAAPDEWWKSIAAFLGMPVEFDAPAEERRPVVTWFLAAVIITASVHSFFHLHEAVQLFGLIPAQATRMHGLTFVTSFFLHAGIIHLDRQHVFSSRLRRRRGKFSASAALHRADCDRGFCRRPHPYCIGTKLDDSPASGRAEALPE